MSNQGMAPATLSDPIILAVDTSSSVAGFAIASGTKVISSLTVNTGRPHSQDLFSNISSICRFAGYQLNEIGVFAAVTGPGSFTGLRVGLSAVKGIADSLGRPVLGGNAFDLLALSTGHNGLHLLMISAGRGEVYCGLREVNVKGVVRCSPDDMVCDPVLIKDIFVSSTQPPAPIIVFDRDHDETMPDDFLEIWNDVPGSVHRFRRDRINLATYLAISVNQMLQNGNHEPLSAYYIRPPDAQIKNDKYRL